MKRFFCRIVLLASLPVGLLSCGAQAVPSPGTTQRPATETAPQLDGRAVLTVGTAYYLEGKDFHLLASSPAWAAGTLARLSPAELRALAAPGPSPTTRATAARAAEGRFVLLPQLPAGATATSVADALARMGAVAVILVSDDAVEAMLGGPGGTTRVELQAGAAQPPLAILGVSSDVMKQLLGGQADQAATLAVHLLPAAAPLRTAGSGQ